MVTASKAASGTQSEAAAAAAAMVWDERQPATDRDRGYGATARAVLVFLGNFADGVGSPTA